MSRNVATILFALGLAPALLAPYGPAAADTLAGALVEAYLGNPALAAERAAQRANDELVPQALSLKRPQIFGSISQTATRGKIGTRPVGSGSSSIDADTSSTSLTLQQNLYDGGGTGASVSQAENQVRSGRANLVAVEQQILLEAVQGYVAAWRDRTLLLEALNNEERLGRQRQATQDRFDVGEVARTDVAQAEAELAGARAEVEVRKAAVASSDALFRRVTGREPGQLEQPVPLRGLPSSRDEALALAKANPEIIRATFDAAAAKDQIDVQFSQLLPSVDLQGTLQYDNDPSSSVRWQRVGQLGVTLTVPLYQGGAEHARVREARETFRQQRNVVENTVRSIEEDVASAWDDLISSGAQVPAFRTQIQANEIALEGVNQEALVGTRTVLDVLDTEQDLFESRLDLVRAQANEVFASYQLKAAVGQLTVVGLELPVAPYDPRPHYNDNRDRLWGVSKRP